MTRRPVVAARTQPRSDSCVVHWPAQILVDTRPGDSPADSAGARVGVERAQVAGHDIRQSGGEWTGHGSHLQ